MRNALLVAVLALILCGSDCGEQPKSASGVSKATVKVETGADGFTAEQRNIRDRLVEDNKQGSIKHLYIVSAYSGQVIIYSTVRGKVTSGGKRLTPTSITGSPGGNLPVVTLGNTDYYTNEVLQDDGAYGQSMDYLYWWDTKGVYHQHYVSGGQIVHISSQPLAVKSIIINMEISPKPEEEK